MKFGKLLLKRRKLNNKGMTLTELIVSFALLALFMVAATQVISYTVSIYYNARNAGYAMEVATMLKNKVAGELENANDKVEVSKIPSATGNMDSVTYNNKDGSELNLYVLDGYLHITYPKQNVYEETEWYYDSNVYMGYVITDFAVTKASTAESGFKDNVLHIEITLYNEKYGYEYKTESYIKCYNIDSIDSI